MITLMYITNKPEVALIAERSNVDRVFLDMEYIGKAERQRRIDVGGRVCGKSTERALAESIA